MQPNATNAEGMLDALAERMAQWRLGARSGGLYAQMQDAGHAIAKLPRAREHEMRTRLNALAMQIGVCMTDGVVEGLPGAPALACIVRTGSSCDAIEQAVDDLPLAVTHLRIDATASQPTTCEVWLRPPAGRETWTRRVGAASDAIRDHLQRAFDERRIENFVVYCVTR